MNKAFYEFTPINGITYKIIVVDEQDKNLFLNGNWRYGVVSFDQQVIYLSKSGTAARRYAVLMHELAHVFLYETQIDMPSGEETYDLEAVCEFVGIYADRMTRIADDFFKEAGIICDD